MAKCSPKPLGHDIPAVVDALLTTSERTVCRETFKRSDPQSADPLAATEPDCRSHLAEAIRSG